MVELRHLRYFVAVAEELSFSRAAERLRMAQPPLSVAIRQLEQEIGATRFNRNARPGPLTGAGGAFLGGARRTLQAADLAIEAAGRAAAGETGRIRIGYSSCTRSDILPTLAREYESRFPEVQLLTEVMWHAQLREALISEAIDVALAPCPDKSAELSYSQLGSETVVALLPASHRLAQAERVDASELCDDDLLIFPREFAPTLYDQLTRLRSPTASDRGKITHSLHTHLTLGTWAGESFVALAPGTLPHDVPAGVVARPGRGQHAALDTYLFWRTSNDSPALAAFIDVAREAFSAGQPASRANPPAAAPELVAAMLT